MKTFKRFLFSGMGLTLLLILSGCVQTNKQGLPTGEGFVYQYLVAPMSQVIKYFANDLGLGFGLAIILVTVIVRLIILPLGLYQSWNATYQSEKRNYLSTIFTPIHERMKSAETQEEKLEAQQALMQAQKENGLSMLGGVGCLPLLIQMPFFSALFFAARYTEGVTQSNFLGINLGQQSLILTIFVGILYYIQSLLSLVGLDEEQKDQMKKMLYMSPLMIVIFSFTSPAGVTLYWVVGGFVQILQQFIINFFIRPYMKKRVEEEYEKNPPKTLSANSYIKNITPKANAVVDNRPKNKKKNRNAGRQRSR